MSTRIFEVGDFVSRGPLYSNERAQIMAIRHAVGNANIGSLSLGADLLTERGKVVFAFMHDIARNNPQPLAARFAAVEAAP